MINIHNTFWTDHDTHRKARNSNRLVNLHKLHGALSPERNMNKNAFVFKLLQALF